MDCGLAPLFSVPFLIFQMYHFQGDKATELYLTFPKSTGGESSPISTWVLFPVVGERVRLPQARSQSGLIWDITSPTGWLQSDFWQERD